MGNKHAEERKPSRTKTPTFLLEMGFPVTGPIPFSRAVGAPVNPLVVK